MNEPDLKKTTAANFWKRIFAFGLDFVLIFLVGFLLSIPFEPFFIESGVYGVLIGISISLIYFSIGNSALTHGQTIGKKVMKIRVTDQDGKPINFSKSLLRAGVLFIPLLLNGSSFLVLLQDSWVIYPISMLIFGSIISIVYLYIFNRRTRQSLHDLVTATYVVKSDLSEKIEPYLWKGHYIIVGVFILLSLSIPIYVHNISQENVFSDLTAIQETINRTTNSKLTGVMVGSSFQKGANGETVSREYARVTLWLPEADINNPDLAKEIVLRIIEEYAALRNKDVIRVTLRHGYHIGIWSRWQTASFDFIPSELMTADDPENLELDT